MVTNITGGGTHPYFFVGGWSGPNKDGEEKMWKPNTEAVWATIKYAVSTGRLDNKQEQIEGEASKRSDEFDGGEASDTNNED